MKNIIILIGLICSFSTGFRQSNNDNLRLNVNLKFDNNKLLLAQQYVSKQKDTLSFNVIKFYLSEFEIHYTDKSISKGKSSYQLIDIEDPETFKIDLKKQLNKEIKFLKFNIGIDSLASVSGAMDGDLDATKGMYWSWQSGFINMKVEGQSSSCKTRKNKFKFHIGGYLKPNYAMRKVVIEIKNSQNQNNEMNLFIDFGYLFSEISLKDTNTIMMPGKKAMNLANISTKLFSIQ